MRNIPTALQAKLDAGVTTICSCWRIDRKKDGALGFTDHDADLSFDGLTFEAASGFEASSIEHSLGLSIDNMSAKGALQSARINEEDIARGRYDAAEVRQWLVDWSDPASRVLTFRGEIGEIRRGPSGFEVELRGLAERLNRTVMRQYLPVCDAMLGDKACGVNGNAVAFRRIGTVLSVIDARRIVCGGLDGLSHDWLTGGVLKWQSGSADGDVVGIRQHTTTDDVVTLTCDRDLFGEIASGQSFEAIAGCDKRAETCRDKFNNLKNFRGFPFIPGDGWLGAYPVDGGPNDGGSRG